jgi:putative acetyltransferase
VLAVVALLRGVQVFPFPPLALVPNRGPGCHPGRGPALSAQPWIKMNRLTGNPVIIREETVIDRDAVREVNRAVFGGDAEADLVERLHADGDVLLSLVADDEGRVVGHLLFSRLPIETATGVLSAVLAPLAVLPERQRRGIGAALVRHGLHRCQEHGVAAVIVLGDPAYYGRFGFTVEAAHGLQTPWSGPHLMAIELMPGGMTALPGIAHYPAAFSSLA